MSILSLGVRRTLHRESYDGHTYMTGLQFFATALFHSPPFLAIYRIAIIYITTTIWLLMIDTMHHTGSRLMTGSQRVLPEGPDITRSQRDRDRLLQTHPRRSDQCHCSPVDTGINPTC